MQAYRRTAFLFLFIFGIAGAAILCTASPARAQEADDQTLSPYFFVRSDDPEVDALPLKATSADVDIAGVIADVRVEQVYVNEGERALEAIYIFPASTRAAVYGMTMYVGARTLEARVQEREAARQAYEQAREEGRSASLLEQQRPNVFQMNVANILPGDTIRVELRYTELLVPEKGVYEFVYPTVVGPRYSNQPAATASERDLWVENPYLQEGEDPPYTFDLTARLSAGLPIQQIASPSHQVDVHFDGETDAAVMLDPSEAHGGDRDFILRYRLQGGQIASGLLLFEGEEENFFLGMVQPPERVAAERIPPREYLFVVDVSGSMRGFPLEVSKQLLRDLIRPLRPQDRFNVLLFAGGAEVLAEQSLSATEGNIKRALAVIDGQHGGGGTELVQALQRAFALPKAEGYARTVVVATDGYVNFERAAYDAIREGLDEANVFAFGIGTGVNRYLIEGMARAGQGEAFVATSAGEATAMAERFRRYIATPALTQVRASFDGFEVYDVEPPALPDLFAERPVVFFGKWRGEPEGTITLRGQAGEEPFVQHLDVRRYQPQAANGALRYLWARHRIALLSDYGQLGAADEEIRQAVTDLGLNYNLLTPYTSFVAIDTEVRSDGEVATVKQPLPLPQGVPNTAVGGAVPQAASRLSLDASLPSEALQMEETVVQKTPGREARSESGVFVIVEQMPQLQPDRKEGMEQLQTCVAQSDPVQRDSLSGRLFVRFVVDEQGRVTNVRVVRGLRDDVDAVAVRCVQQLRFVPGRQHGQPVKVQLSLPITVDADPSQSSSRHLPSTLWPSPYLAEINLRYTMYQPTGTRSAWVEGAPRGRKSSGAGAADRCREQW